MKVKLTVTVLRISIPFSFENFILSTFEKCFVLALQLALHERVILDDAYVHVSRISSKKPKYSEETV